MLRAAVVVLCGRTAYATETVRHDGASFSFVSCVDGATIWNDRSYAIYSVPDVLRGARLYQGPHRLAYNEAIEISMPEGGRAFAAFTANRDGDMPAGLRDDGWVDVASQGLHWDYGVETNYIVPLLSKIIAPGETYTSPKNAGSDTVMFVVLDLDPERVAHQLVGPHQGHALRKRLGQRARQPELVRERRSRHDQQPRAPTRDAGRRQVGGRGAGEGDWLGGDRVGQGAEAHGCLLEFEG